MATILAVLLDFYIQLVKRLETLNLVVALLCLMVEEALQKENAFTVIIKEIELIKQSYGAMTITNLH
jgi:hypothetical protein